MIVPTKRLIVCYALSVPPLALLQAWGNGAVGPLLGVLLLSCLVTLLDGLFAPRRSRGINVRLPETVRMTKGRQSSLELTLEKGRVHAEAVRLGLPFPPEISSLREDLSVTLPRDAEIVRVAWPCTAYQRGQFRINTCYVETRSRLGLWVYRTSRGVTSEVRVYPNLAMERRSLAALFLNRGGFGIHAQRQQGKGREFERLRDYIPGDGFEDIHWKATAKRRRPISKVFQVERAQEVYVAIDASRLSARPSKVPIADPGRGDDPGPGSVDSQLERFITAALVVGLAAQKQGDLFGVLTFSDSVHDFLRAGGGRPHYSACRDHIFSLCPRMVNPDYEEFCTFIRLKLRRRALIIMLTSLDDPVLAESLTRTMDLICRHHLVMVNMFRPEGARPLFSNPAVSSTEQIYGELSGHGMWHNLRELEKNLARHGVHFSLLDNERLCVDLVSQYLGVKQRQLL